MPSIKDFFPGKPLKTEKGEAFILDHSTKDTFTIQYTKGGHKEQVPNTAFLEERDSDEILYDEKEL